LEGDVKEMRKLSEAEIRKRVKRLIKKAYDGKDIFEEADKFLSELTEGLEKGIYGPNPLPGIIAIAIGSIFAGVVLGKLLRGEKIGYETLRWIVNEFNSFFLSVLKKIYAYLLPTYPVTYEKAMETAAKFLSLCISLSLIPQVVRLVIGWIFPQQARVIARALEQPYWILGLGFLGWQTMSIPLEFGIRRPLRDHFESIYRYRKVALSKIEFLFEHGMFNEDKYAELLAGMGFDEKEGSIIIMESRVRIAEKEIKDLSTKIRRLARDYARLIKAKIKYLLKVVDELMAEKREEEAKRWVEEIDKLKAKLREVERW